MFGSGELLLSSDELILGSGEKQGDGVRLGTCNCEKCNGEGIPCYSIH